ncbi:unnamed protein product [Trichobilharzia szidati]|nr:unnamed protein product [Trichobilharzia szidati]
MGRPWTLSLVPGLIIATVLACVLCDPSSLQSDVPISRPNEGLSTASDTLNKEAEAISLDGLSLEQLKQAREQAEKRQFEAEVDRMMKIIVNSLYKNKEIFLRELISNASDALDKIRVLALTNREVLDEADEMNIRIKANKEARTLHIIDTGIGMTKAELTANLGTIAKSGTSEFLANITQTTSAAEKSDLIGQFGVGFYSSFLVANKVIVVSKSDTDDQHIWESNSTSFTVYKDPRGNTLKRGTEIILYLTEEAEDYLQPETLKEVVKKYSQFINFPIYVWSSRVEKENVESQEETKTSDSEASVEEESVKSEGKTVDKVVWDWVRVNANKPIWRRKPSEVTDKEYNELFHVYSKEYDDPLARIHFTGEGDVIFNSILYIPKRSPSNIFQMHSSHSDRIKLYVRRVYISDVADDLLPKYLAFVVGIVDSDELPLNVSREMLQQNKLLKTIKKRLVKKVIEMISKLSESDFEKFWNEYSVNIKLGIIDDHSNRSKLSKLLRFWTSNSTEKQSSLADYVSRMKKGQEEIYYITAASINEAKLSPFAERLIEKGYEIVYMVDPVDEYMLQSLTEYDKKKLRNVAKGTIELDKSEDAKSRKEALQKEFEPLLQWFKDALKEYVDQTTLSERLSNTPCALVANEFGWSGNMERIMTAQAYQRGGDPSTSYYSSMKKVFEINPRHPVMKKLNALIKSNKDDPTINHTASLLFDVAVLRSGFSVKNPVAFAERVETVVKKSLDIDPSEEVEKEPVEISDEQVTETDEEIEEKTAPIESSSEDKVEEPKQSNGFTDTLEENRTESTKLYSSNELDSISEYNTRLPITSSSESDIIPDFEALNNCPTCRRLLECKSHGHHHSAKNIKDNNNNKDEKAHHKQIDTDGEDDDDDDDDDVDSDYRHHHHHDDNSDIEDDSEENEEDNDNNDQDSGIDLGTRKLMAVKTPSTPQPKTKINSESTSGNAKNKKPSAVPTAQSKVNSKAANTKTAENVKFKQNKEKSPPTHHQHQQDKSKSPPSKHAEDHSKKAMPKSVPQPEKAKKPNMPKSKHVRIVGNINDHDCDGIPDDIDEDIDNDGLLDRTQDSDWDGLLNHIDEDDDNDGIPDIEDEDSNGDGIPDCRSDVSDLKLKIRYKKKMKKIDSDFDGIPDDDDGDDDDDGIPDILEDEDKDQIPDYLGLTRNDFLKGVSIKELNKRMNKRGWFDHDCDGIPDNLDPDDDNDGYFDAKQDSDRDGILNEFDDDDDNDGIPDKDDPDSNGDGIPDCIVKDSDGDHIPDHIDTDDDNDGIPDLQDPDHPMFDYFRDSDKDGIPDPLDKDDDNDGIPDSMDYDSDGDGTDDLFQDVDRDGVPDSVDDDMNNDGIPDHKQDHDCDGIPDIVDPDDDNDGYFDTKQDSDNDGILNEWDDDDDNDGIPDVDDEDSNGDGIIDCQPRDSDGDGIPDHLDEDDDNDGIPDQRDPDSMSFLLYKHKRFLEAVPAHIARNEANLLNVDLGDPNDKDCDGIPDHIDNDLDNDGKIDRTQDSDMDGLLNHVDDDDDNDGIPDPLDPDANGDGIPDCRRDGGLHYKLVRSPSGLIKKVLRIREPTQEEQHMAYMVNEAKRKLIRIRAKLGEPVPKNTIQAVPSVTFNNAYGDNPDNPKNNNDGKKIKAKSTNTKTVPTNPTVKSDHSHTPTSGTPTTKQSANNKPATGGIGGGKKSPTQAGKSNPSTLKQSTPTASAGEHGAKSANKRQNRKLANYVPSETADPLYALNKDILFDIPSIDDISDGRIEEENGDDDDDGDMSVNLAEPNLKTSIFGSFLLPGAAADESTGQRRTKAIKMKQNEGVQTITADKMKVKKKKTNDNDKSKKDSCDAHSCRKSNMNQPNNQPGKKHVKSGSIKDYLHKNDDESLDLDGDGIPDHLEDDDGDGIPNYLEDEDGDGIPDSMEGDSDGDGIPDYMEDEDGDGIPDYLEDEDGDGIPDYLDGCVHGKHNDDDDDNDGIKDYQEDANNNQILDIFEAKDTDGDGIPDYLDDDDDGDGIPDCDDDDDDNDGILDIHEDENKNKIPDYLETGDSDNDVRGSKSPSKSASSQPKSTVKSKSTALPKKVGKHTVDDDDDDDDEDEKPSKRKDSGVGSDDDDDETDDAEHMSKARSIVLSILKRIENFFGVEDDDNDNHDSEEETHDH